MRHTVLIENADTPFSEGIQMIRRIRPEQGADLLTVIAEGDLRSDGLPAETSAQRRAGSWMEAGADLVLQLPVFSTLGGYGKKNFADAVLIQKLHSADRVILPSRPLPGQTVEECGALLRRCAMLMFREHPDYRRRLQENLRRRQSFLDAQMDAVILCIPEAGELLRYPENRQSVCMLDAMLQLYYIVRVDFIGTAPGGADGQVPGRAEGQVSGVSGTGAGGQTSGASDEKAGREIPDAKTDGQIPGAPGGDDGARLSRFERRVARGLRQISEEQSADFLMRISGSTEKAVSRIMELSGEIGENDSLREIVERAESAFPNTDMARLFLLRAVLNIRHGDMLIGGLHTYVPYCRLLAAREERQEELRRIEETSWVPFLRTVDPEQSGQMDETIRMLLAIDRRAELLFAR